MKALANGTRVLIGIGSKTYEYGPVEAAEGGAVFAHANLGRQVKVKPGQTGVVTGFEGPLGDPNGYYVRLDERGPKPGRVVKLYPRQVTAPRTITL